jgi:hypothetical protein
MSSDAFLSRTSLDGAADCMATTALRAQYPADSCTLNRLMQGVQLTSDVHDNNQYSTMASIREQQRQKEAAAACVSAPSQDQRDHKNQDDHFS